MIDCPAFGIVFEGFILWDDCNANRLVTVVPAVIAVALYYYIFAGYLLWCGSEFYNVRIVESVNDY